MRESKVGIERDGLLIKVRRTTIPTLLSRMRDSPLSQAKFITGSSRPKRTGKRHALNDGIFAPATKLGRRTSRPGIIFVL